METEYVERLIKVEQSDKSAHHRIDEHDEQIKELSNVYVALTKVDNKVTNVEKDVTEIKSDLKEIKDKPAKNWDKVITSLISTLVGAIAGAFISLILK